VIRSGSNGGIRIGEVERKMPFYSWIPILLKYCKVEILVGYMHRNRPKALKEKKLG